MKVQYTDFMGGARDFEKGEHSMSATMIGRQKNF